MGPQALPLPLPYLCLPAPPLLLQLIGIGIVIYQLVTEPNPDAKHELFVKPGGDSGATVESQLVAFFNVSVLHYLQMPLCMRLKSLRADMCAWGPVQWAAAETRSNAGQR